MDNSISVQVRILYSATLWLLYECPMDALWILYGYYGYICASADFTFIPKQCACIRVKKHNLNEFSKG